MQRPPSIIRYEQLYIASVVISLIVGALTYRTRVDLLAANPTVAGYGTSIVTVTTVIGLVISAVLWWYTARQPGIVAKWIVVVFAAFGALGIVLALPTLSGTGPVPLYAVVAGIVANALYIAAAVLLFRPDAKLWFGEAPSDDDAGDAA
jgi:peptidoglycan/LPS O-acetylase OafA/YrhL